MGFRPDSAEHQHGAATRGELARLRGQLIRDIEDGRIQFPFVQPTQPNIAGGTNHAPNSDLSYSLMAATTASITPGTAGDTNHECYRFYRQQKGANVGTTGADALKAAGHSLFAANEGATPAIPRWDRVNGWAEIGSTGTQYDIAINLLNNVVMPGQRWYVRFRCGALNSATLPSNVQAFAGIWHKTGAGEGWIQGNAFNLSHEIIGAPGATSVDYRVLAKTDSGVSILSNVLTIANVPAALSTTNYVKLYFNAGPGFIEFQIYKKVGAVYTHVYTVRNSTDLQYNDTGTSIGPVSGWPSVSGNSPQAYAETSSLLVGSFGSEWGANDLVIAVPSTYDFSQTQAFGQFLRIGLTNPTGVDRHVGIDRVWFSTTYNEWSPDGVSYPSGPSVSPTSGSQGAGEGVFNAPPVGGGGRTCVRTNTPVLTVDKGRHFFRRFDSVKVGSHVKGEHREAYAVLSKREGTVSEFRRIRTRNGITLECSADHELIVDLEARRRVGAEAVEVGERLACLVKGRKTKSVVVSNDLIPEPAEVGTFTLRHLGGLVRDGLGLYVAGLSKNKDRGLYCSNVKTHSI